MYVCRSPSLLSKLVETLLRGKVAILICVTASFEKMGFAAGINKIPFPSFKILAFNI